MSLSKETLDKALEKLRENAKARYETKRKKIIEKYEATVRETEEKYKEVAKKFSKMLIE